MITLKIVPVILEDGTTYLDIYHDGAVDRVGPVTGEELTAVLEPPNVGKGGPPTNRMKRISQKQERRNADLLGGRTQPGSGSGRRAKGDVRKHGEYRGESKFTFAQSYVLHRATLEKIASECRLGEKPIVFLDFKERDTGKSYGSYVILHENDFEELLKHAPSNDSRPAKPKRR